MKFFPRKFTVLLFEIANNCQQSKCLHRGDLLNADNSEGRIYKPLTNWKRKGLIFFFFLVAEFFLFTKQTLATTQI